MIEGMLDLETMKILYCLQDEMDELRRRIKIIDRKLKELDDKEQPRILASNDIMLSGMDRDW